MERQRLSRDHWANSFTKVTVTVGHRESVSSNERNKSSITIQIFFACCWHPPPTSTANPPTPNTHPQHQLQPHKTKQYKATWVTSSIRHLDYFTSREQPGNMNCNYWVLGSVTDVALSGPDRHSKFSLFKNLGRVDVPWTVITHLINLFLRLPSHLPILHPRSSLPVCASHSPPQHPARRNTDKEQPERHGMAHDIFWRIGGGVKLSQISSQLIPSNLSYTKTSQESINAREDKCERRKNPHKAPQCPRCSPASIPSQSLYSSCRTVVDSSVSTPARFPKR